ncbi:low-density lipoprotein receptor-related protein 4 [Parasteatoda tepidariorum]|uniref:low-density lipoprotein receptor-related protein 4 n=1 Tax=Parasteatoda tepidariorum TaxID=114398 RepID=UPI001C723573|nr:low-density lipoprotein receptor-related protein 4-like [Parasteatoda tepidariorum]
MCRFQNSQFIFLILLLLASYNTKGVAARGTACSCSVNHFACTTPLYGNCTCIPVRWRCDSDDDCGDGSDEIDCDAAACSRDMFMCNSGKCIITSWWCDGENDCGDYSDETDCSPRNCSKKEFPCANGRCIPSDWRCDGTNQCGDNSDEDCSAQSCASNEFRCNDGGCIIMDWTCDGSVDCQDGSDEDGCHEDNQQTCPPNQLKCVNSRCVSESYICDGDNDCGDWTDESKCPGEAACRDREFRCDDGLCINVDWKCDGENDCDDMSDEKDCQMPECGEEEFQCRAGRCIKRQWRCDGEFDCADNSDEDGCAADECAAGQFRCNDGSCISQLHVCNGEYECPDGSDELENRTCKTGSPCREDGFPCQHLCLSTSTGPRCACKHGYHLALDRRSCRDIDECQVEGTCSQFCENTVPGYKCTCVEGYRLGTDKRKCKATGPDPYLMYANRADIRIVSLSSMDPPSKVLSGLQNAIAVDFHYESGRIFWSDITTDVIRSAYFNGSGVADVITYGLTSPAGLAVHWPLEKILWTDSGTSRIEVAAFDGSMRRVLIWKNLEKPRAIVVNPEEGTLYWTDWGSRPRIEKAMLDGSERKAIVDTSLFWPNGLTIDYPSQRLYWADAKHHVIETSALDGSGRKRVIEKELPHPFAITVFEDHLFWTDWQTKSIHRANKFTGRNATTLHTKLHFPMDIIVVHPLRQPAVRDPCAEDNGGCSHLCMPNNVSYTCLCTVEAPVQVDEKTCSKEWSSFLIFTRRTDVRWLCLDCEDDADVVFPFRNISSAGALDFDAETETIYWSDITNDTISRSNINGSHQQVVIKNTLESPDGLAIDWITRKLYWTDSGTHRIEVSNLDGAMRTILIWESLGKPRDIVVDPTSGFMYWTDWGDYPKIERSGMDGSQRTVVIDRNLTWPNCLAIDQERKKLYWTDAGTRTIEMVDYDGRNRQVLISLALPHPFGLALYGDSIYWTDWTEHNIQSANKVSGKDRKIIFQGLEILLDVHVFHRQRPNVTNECKTNNGGCSHLCLMAPKPAGFACKCPTGILLQSDKKTCAKGMKNFLIMAKRTDIRKISLDVPYTADVVLPISNLHNVIALDVDTKGEKIYLSDTDKDRIQSSDLDGSRIEHIITKGLGSVDFLAVDSIGRKLYWTDDQRKCIEVSELDGSHRKVLIWSNLDSPRAIALHYEPGFMYWTDWGNKPRIERSEMDGGKRVIIISDTLGWPNGLTIDKENAQLVWADARRHVIEACNLDGHHRRILVSDVPHPYGIAVTARYIYWTDWSERSILRANKHTGKNMVNVCANLPNLMDMHSIKLNETGVNKCEQHNGGCSHLCLRTSLGYSCACPTGIRLQDNEQTCEEAPSTFLLFANRESVRRISLDTTENMDVYLPIHETYNTVAVDFDYQEKSIYYSDVKLDVIRCANWNGSNVKTIISSDLVTADGLALDWVAKNLYWADSGRNIIEVSRSDGTCRKVLIDIDLDEPRAIVVFPRKGYLFWSDWGKPPKIERAYLDGSSRRVIVATDLGWPNGLTIDYEARRLYWVDAQLDRIESSDLSGKHRVQLVQDVSHPFGLTLFGPHLYWTDWHTKSIERVDIEGGRNRIVIRDNIEYLMEIKMVALSRQTGNNPCGELNGGCSHLCLFRPHGHVCACPSYPDSRPCSTVPGEILPEPTKVADSDEVATLIESSVPTAMPANNNSTRCTEVDVLNGRCHLGFTPHDPILQTAYIALSVLLLLVGIVLIIALIFWKKNKKRRNEELESTLTFSNPTYSASSGDVLPNDRKIWPWKNQHRRDKKQARMTPGVCKEGKLNNLEVSALVSHNKKLSSLEVLHPPAPPQRIDSRHSFVALGASPCKAHHLPIAGHSPMKYRTVETDI